MIIIMHERYIAGLDLNLVPALHALLHRRSVTRAAADVGLSQPAMSRSLARLRELHGDPLLVRTPSGYVLTARAQALRPVLAAAMSHLREVFRPQTFDPGVRQGILRLAAADSHTIVILPAVVARMESEAPGVSLRAQAYSSDTAQQLNDGTLDLVFALSTTPLRAGAYSEVVAEDRLALVMRKGHPAAGQTWSLDDYGSWQHVVVDVNGEGDAFIEAILAARGIGFRVGLSTPTFMGALAVVASTDLVTTMSATFARHFAPVLGLELQDAPLPESRLQITLVCSHVRAADPFLIWFKALVQEVALGVTSGHSDKAC